MMRFCRNQPLVLGTLVLSTTLFAGCAAAPFHSASISESSVTQNVGWWPSKSKSKSKSRRSSPSMMTKMSRGTKSAFKKTASFLDPYPNDAPQKSSSSAKSEPGSFWSWGKKNKQTEYSDANDFLRQPRPDY